MKSNKKIEVEKDFVRNLRVCFRGICIFSSNIFIRDEMFANTLKVESFNMTFHTLPKQIYCNLSIKTSQSKNIKIYFMPQKIFSKCAQLNCRFQTDDEIVKMFLHLSSSHTAQFITAFSAMICPWPAIKCRHDVFIKKAATFIWLSSHELGWCCVITEG